MTRAIDPASSVETSVEGPVSVTGRTPFRLGPFSTVRRPARVLVALVLAVALFLLFCLGVGRGDYPLSIPDVVNVLHIFEEDW